MKRYGWYTWFSAWKPRDRNRAQEVKDGGFDIGLAMITLPRDQDDISNIIKNVTDNFADARRCDLPVIVRFRYGNAEPDAPKARMLKHIDQCFHLLHNFDDIILTLQAGFIGHYGEWHNSTNITLVQDELDIVEAVFNASSKHTIMSFRTMTILDRLSLRMPSDRIGFHNDAIASSSSDMGTWAQGTKAAQIEKWAPQLLIYGGETAAIYETNQNPSAMYREMKLVPYSYMSGVHRDTVLASWKTNRTYEMIYEMMRANSGGRIYNAWHSTD